MKRTIFLLVLACMFGTMSAQITNISSDKRQFDADSVIEEFDNSRTPISRWACH